jgi:DtxR family transcriptional regulator, manganese transport regulator
VILAGDVAFGSFASILSRCVPAEKGLAVADRVRVRHRLVTDVLCALGVPTESAEADAEKIEHHVSETTLKAFAHFLKSRG